MNNYVVDFDELDELDFGGVKIGNANAESKIRKSDSRISKADRNKRLKMAAQAAGEMSVNRRRPSRRR